MRVRSVPFKSSLGLSTSMRSWRSWCNNFQGKRKTPCEVFSLRFECKKTSLEKSYLGFLKEYQRRIKRGFKDSHSAGNKRKMYQQYKEAVERGDEEGVVVRLVMFRQSLYVQ